MRKAELKRLEKMSVHEKRLSSEGFLRIAGVDEAGRGPLAGPVVAAACILPANHVYENLNDSKLLTPEQRGILYKQITATAIYGVGIAEVEVIDKINILQATFTAMKQAIANLSSQPDYLLVDGNQVPYIENIASEWMIEGDSRSVSIAAASIIAKETRDRIMEKYDELWPEYGFKKNKGYASDYHVQMIYKLGPCPIHRKSFDPVRTMLNPKPEQLALF
jgi:ribonuclease HII